ncbi:MAG TPA: hypothetical protein VLU47_07290, partial [Blastocatellia bacterium]|nr:hypothetical protein [Blastocatellia bacterium]
MRKILFALFLVALIAPAITMLRASSADSSKIQESGISPWQSTILGLPDYDLRRELADIELRSNSKPSTETALVQARVDAIEDFRATFSSETRDQLRYEMNEAGVPKALFNLGAALSDPSNGSRDQIARGFLRGKSSVFGLTSRDVSRLKLESEDNDQGITFLTYRQTIGGLSVFQGQVQVVVGAAGEVLSVMEGMVLPGARVDTSPGLT